MGKVSFGCYCLSLLLLSEFVSVQVLVDISDLPFEVLAEEEFPEHPLLRLRIFGHVLQLEHEAQHVLLVRACLLARVRLESWYFFCEDLEKIGFSWIRG